MTTERIGEIIDDPITVSDAEVDELRNLSQDNSWCGTFQLAYLLALKAQGAHQVTSELNRLAIRVYDRAQLHTRFEEIEGERREPVPQVIVEDIQEDVVVQETVEPVQTEPLVNEDINEPISQPEAILEETAEENVAQPVTAPEPDVEETTVEEPEPVNLRAEESSPQLEPQIEVEAESVVDAESAETEVEEPLESKQTLPEVESADELEKEVLASAYSWQVLQEEEPTVEDSPIEQEEPVADQQEEELGEQEVAAELPVEPELTDGVVDVQPEETVQEAEPVFFDFSAIQRIASKDEETEAESGEVLSFSEWIMGRRSLAQAPMTTPVEDRSSIEPTEPSRPASDENKPARVQPLKKKNPEADALIDKFINEHGDGVQGRRKMFDPMERARRSLMDEARQVSETLAKVYAQQGSYLKAIETYQALKLRYPERSTYFAARISELEQNLEE